MSAWITAYLHRKPEGLSAAVVQQGIAQADWLTLGESVGAEDDQVREFMNQLRWSSERLEFSAEPERRPVQLHVWTDSGRVAEELREITERSPAIPAGVRRHLADVQGIVAIELGWNQLQTMYEIVAFEIAYWLAEHYGGVILAPDDQWYDADEHRWQPIEE